ncbi:peptidoglycan-binding domain-containing protein [Actinoplanes sp. NPDC051861]|uniref:peptidoglycan-binding domain-containing protein n=1 Tax=Actinoplanes sp. NPDC051861 TaxID=3155170 RepID=UPI003430DDAD
MAATAGGLLVLLTVGVVGALGLGGASEAQPDARRTGPAATTTVTRETLVEEVTASGELGYGRATPVTSTAAGTVTWLPKVGSRVERGGSLLRVDDQPVVMLYGALPMYRSLSAGLVGSDVRQFERNLSALGYRGITVDETFSPETTAAVKRWQKDLEVPETGVVDRSRVIYTRDAVRISRRLVRVGGSATGDVVEYTGNIRVVTADMNRSEAGWAVKDAKVTLTVPGGSPQAGTVTAVSGETAPTSGGGDEGKGDDGPGENNVTITIGFASQKALGTEAGVTVSVRHVLQRREDVLTVPVNALLALAEGGYGVEVVTGDVRVVAVEAGLFANGRVEIRGSGIEDGTVVGVPA